MILRATAAIKDDGRKLKFFVRSDMAVSYTKFSSLKMQGAMKVNGTVQHANYILRPGDTVEIVMDEASVSRAEASDGDVDVVYEDDDLMIIDKPAPLACQSSSRNPMPALENRLMAKFGPSFVFRPINRLDKGTSGLMCAAKHAHAADLLQRQLHTDQFVRKYLAVVDGRMEGSGRIDLPIAKAGEATVKRVISHETGKPAVTDYETVVSGDARSLVRLRLLTGRTHQIRVHLSSMGHPVTGDFLYGIETADLPGRFALHSAYISLRQPLTGETIKYESPLPDELRKLLDN